MNRNVNDLYDLWVKEVKDAELEAELKQIAGDDEAINDAFYRDLSFGTAGLRGVIGAGTYRMNIYTVAQAAQGQANYYNKLKASDDYVNTVAIAYDSRINSEVFAKVTAAVFAANGFKVHIYPELEPVPALSFAIRELQTDTGVVITASHNPAKYNGFKAYGPDGAQVKTEVANGISAEVAQLDIFNDIVDYDFDKSVEAGDIVYIEDAVMDAYIEHVKGESLIDENTEIDKDVKIIYSPFNGTGLKPVTRALKEMGYTNVSVVKEQEHPDGNFPTVPYPNPQIPESMALGIEYAKREDADLFMATDPDADRVGIAIKGSDGEFQLVSGNLVGTLLIDYIVHRKTEMGTMPDNPVMINTIVTTSLASKVAKSNGVKTIYVLTGFKYIGEQIGYLEAEGREDDYLIGFEESYGYLSGTYARDKDAVNAAVLIAEMFSYYKTREISLLDKIEDIYDRYGYTLDLMYTYTFEGQVGAEKMKQILKDIRKPVDSLAGLEVTEVIDYALGINDLPTADVLQYNLGDNGYVIVRPSGTEPQVKIYVSLSADRDKANDLAEELKRAVEAHGSFV